jgi:hypothetical protein
VVDPAEYAGTGARRRMTLLLQVSDPHFGTERADVVAALEVLVRAQRPDVLLLSGDITQRATRAQFGAARAFVDSPGRAGGAGHSGQPRHSAVQPGGAADVALRALCEGVWPRAGAAVRERCGAGARAEHHTPLAPCRRRAECRADRARGAAHRAGGCTAVAHRGRAPAGGRDAAAEDTHNLLHGHEAAVRRWSAAGADMVLGGHIHLPFVLPLPERWAGLPRPMWAVQAGTAVSRRVRAGAANSVNLIRIRARQGASPPAVPVRQAQVERWDHVAASGAFERVAVHRLLADDGG